MHKRILPPSWLQFFIVTLLVLGVFFRFVNLDRKVYWIDETYTSLRISGHTETEFIQQVFDGHVVNLKELQKYQQPNPEKGLVSTINSLAVESPQHPPLYYVMARFWGQWLGNSPAAIRSLSAIISLLVFPCVYWLCLELFGSLTGWIAIALIAVSPFHILYAQEAREYSLWTVTIALSSAALLHAIRLKSIRSWVIYAATVALGLYTFIFSIFVIIGHAVYVICYLGIPLAVAYLLATQIASPATNLRQQKIWQLVLIVIITGSILSCAVSSQAEFWWNKSPDKHRYNPQVAAIVNSATQPLLISDNSTAISSSFACRILALSYLLSPKVKLQLVVAPNIPQIPDGFSDVFVFSPDQALRQGIEKQDYTAELVFQRDNFWLWKLAK